MFSAVLLGVVIALNGVMLTKLVGKDLTPVGWGSCLLVVAIVTSLAKLWQGALFEQLDQTLIGAVLCI